MLYDVIFFSRNSSISRMQSLKNFTVSQKEESIGEKTSTYSLNKMEEENEGSMEKKLNTNYFLVTDTVTEVYLPNQINIRTKIFSTNILNKQFMKTKLINVFSSFLHFLAHHRESESTAQARGAIYKT